MKGIQRIISGWLAFCLVLSMLPMQVFAVEETVMEPVETTEIGTETASESTTDEDVATTVETTVGTTAASEKAETTEEATVAETETVEETTDTLPAETVFETEATVPNTVETTEATEPVVETTVAEEVIEETIAEDAEGAVTDSDEQERTVASDFAWTYDEKRHKLTISGNGDMPSWEAYEDAPWFSLDSQMRWLNL